MYQFSNDEWVEIYHFTITTEYQIEAGNGDRLGPRDYEDLRAFDSKGVNDCKRGLDPKDLYDNLEKFGYQFGPTFQALKQVLFSNNSQATAVLDPREWMRKVRGDRIGLEHVIHPTMLDAILQLTSVALSEGTWEPIETLIPKKHIKMLDFKRLTVPCRRSKTSSVYCYSL